LHRIGIEWQRRLTFGPLKRQMSALGAAVHDNRFLTDNRLLLTEKSGKSRLPNGFARESDSNRNSDIVEQTDPICECSDTVDRRISDAFQGLPDDD
jgi:hypothetical protein